MRALSEYEIPFRDFSGNIVAHVKLTPVKEPTTDASTPLVQIDDAEAHEHGETSVQLRESERYEYQVISETFIDLRLRCSLSSRRRSLGTDCQPDAGLIETKSFCGTLLLELVLGPVEDEKSAVASALIDVRSLKLDYRTEYRGMLRRLADELASIVVDARSSAKVDFKSSFEQRTDVGWLQLQLELLREILDSSEFATSMQRILSYPHERLSTVIESVSTDRSIRWTPSALRQLASSNPRRAIPFGHPMRTSTGLASVAQSVFIPRRSRDLDTPENRFIKFALSEFLSFLANAQHVFGKAKGWGASEKLAKRLAESVEDWLGHSFFSEMGFIRLTPLSSPVLQRKEGYREVLRWWLRFTTAAEISWDGGADIFKAGQRDVATLYEYWLFFVLLDWFYSSCRAGFRPAVDELIDGLEDGSPNLRLKKLVELGPFEGSVSSHTRKLHARFSYNKRFRPSAERSIQGSWTRALHPDYTLTFWPEGISEEVAEREELLVHIHLDAKYRVENIEGLFGIEDDDADEEIEGNYKRQDLLKMHAYRDAIKRSQGAYVLYPGRGNKPVRFAGFHEILPGLGAFSVTPDEFGKAQGMDNLSQFLDKLLAHLCNRATSRERSAYHLYQAYMSENHNAQPPVMNIPELDSFGHDRMALPPDEHMVMLALRCEEYQISWMSANAVGIVRLGQLSGGWRIQSTWAGVRHLLLRVKGQSSVRGLWRLTKPGYQVITDTDLLAQGYPVVPCGDVYAVFDIERRQDMLSVTWNTKALVRAARNFERIQSHLIVKPTDRLSMYPRLLTLADLINTLTGS